MQLISQPFMLLFFIGVVFVGLDDVFVQPILEKAFRFSCKLIATFLLVRLVGSLLDYGIRAYVAKRGSDETLTQTISALIPALTIIIWVIGIVFLLDNIGLNISAVVAGLGIGGIAIALAAQGIFQNLFGYFSMIFDRPFEIGDFVIVGDLVGTIEHLGLRTTRLFI